MGTHPQTGTNVEAQRLHVAWAIVYAQAGAALFCMLKGLHKGFEQAILVKGQM